MLQKWYGLTAGSVTKHLGNWNCLGRVGEKVKGIMRKSVQPRTAWQKRVQRSSSNKQTNTTTTKQHPNH